MKVLHLVFLLSFCSNPGSGVTIVDSVNFQLEEAEIHMDLNKPGFEVTATLGSSPHENYVLYAFRRTVIAASAYDSIFFATLPGSKGAGNALFVLNGKGDRQTIVFDDCDDCYESDKKVYQSDFLKNAKEEIRAVYLETTEVLDVSEKGVRLKIDFQGVRLAKGEYQFYMIYYCGENIDALVGRSKVDADEKKYDATIFRGWVKSNLVKLIVE